MRLLPKSRRGRTIALVLLSTALLAGVGAYAWGRTRAAEPVELTTVTRGPIAATVSGVADIEAQDRSVLSLSPTTKVVEVRVEEGQQVLLGDILVVLDTGELESQLEQQLITLADAEATLDYLAGPGAGGNAGTAQDAIDQASIALDGARANLRAATTNQATVRAFGANAVAQAELAVTTARTAASAAANNVNTVRTLGDNQVRQAEIALDNAEAAVRLAETNLDRLEDQLEAGEITQAQYDAQRPSLELALTNAENGVASAETALDNAQTAAAADLAAAEKAQADADAGVRSAELALADARTRADADNTAAAKAVADAQRAVDSAEVTLSGAKGAANVTGSTDAEKISNQTSQIALINAQIRYLEDQIGQAHLRASVDGVVTEVDAVVNEYPQAGDQVVVDGTTHLVASLLVDQADSGEIRAGQRATVTPRGLDKTYPGVVSEVAPVAEVEATSTDTDPQVTVTIAITEPDDDLRIGFEADAEVVIDERAEALQVVREAVQTEPGGGSFLLTVDADGRVERTEVETGITTDTMVEIRSGVPEGQRCVADADASVSEGTRVREA